MDFRRYYSPLILPVTAIFALLWAVARACVQSITIDEADTYLVWVARHDPSHWEAASNNHVLNSLLMRLSTSVFGVSHLSVRAPALLGAALYILAAYLLCRKLTPELRLQWPVFVCLVYNPFIFDYLVAARGYQIVEDERVVHQADKHRPLQTEFRRQLAAKQVRRENVERRAQ